MKHVKHGILLVLPIFLALLLQGCSSDPNEGHVNKVGMILEGEISDNPWNQSGYRGLTTIRDEMGVEIYFKEGVETKADIEKAVETFARKGVNLIFGQSNSYGRPFLEAAESFPDVHFVYFNGSQHAENVTSYNFNAFAMGFFAGMVAAEKTETDQVGIIAAYEWQPELEGYYEGVKYHTPSASVHIDYVNDWNDTGSALDAFDRQKDEKVDVIYPAGNQFSGDVIEQASKEDIYTIGYIADQSQIAPDHVLTSTIQHVDKLYTMAAKQFNNQRLAGGVHRLGFADDVISLAPYSQILPRYFRNTLEYDIRQYKKTGELPNQRAVH